MGSIVMDDAIVGAHSIVAAGAVVLEGTRIEAGSIYAGVPAKRVKQSDIEEMRARLNPTSQKYVEYSKWFQ
jgi:carbonic anhydrase/acetyltransferase-like protein (isoleucine patch superfamily)